jgi:hypothetical protein
MTSVATGRALRPPRTGRSNGQWAVDGREPLNPNEEFKAADNGLNVRERIETIYARDGFDSIPSEDLYGRFRWWGLYTQRKPGIDGGRTASLEPHELEDSYFMLRASSTPSVSVARRFGSRSSPSSGSSMSARSTSGAVQVSEGYRCRLGSDLRLDNVTWTGARVRSRVGRSA